MQCTVGTDAGDPFTLIPNVLGLDSVTLMLQRDPSDTSATMAASLTVLNKLVLGVMVTADAASKAWSIGGSIDIPATALNIHQDATVPVTVLDLVTTVFGFGLGPVDTLLSAVTITELAGTVTIADSERSYTVDAAMSVDWNLGASGAAQTTIHIEGDDSGKKSGTVSADVTFDGFEVTLSYIFGSTAQTLDVTAVQLGKLTAQYAMGGKTLTFKFDASEHETLGELIGGFIGIITGNPYTTLPAPWSILDDPSIFDISKLSLTIDFSGATKITVDYTNPGMISFFGCTCEWGGAEL